MSQERDFFRSVKIQFGPKGLLRAFFADAEKVLREKGIELYITDLSFAAEVQQRNQDSWAMFPPMLDTRLSRIDPKRSFALLGKDTSGRYVCAQAARFYDTGPRSFKEIVETQEFFYGDDAKTETVRPRARTTAPTAQEIRGKITYSGALWVHTDFRHDGLASILPRISRVCGLATWDSEYTVGMVRKDRLKVEKAKKLFGYPHVEEDFAIAGLADEELYWYLMIMDRGDLVEDLIKHLA